MDCNKASLLMDRLLSEELDFWEIQALWEHANECSICKAEMKKVSRFIEVLRYKPDVSPPDNIVQRIMASVEFVSPPKKGFLPDAIQAFFTVSVLVLIGSLYPIWQKVAVKNVFTRLYFRTAEGGFDFISWLARGVTKVVGQAGLFAVAVVILVAALAAVELTLRFSHRGN